MDIETRRQRDRRIQTIGLAMLVLGIHVAFLIYSRPGFLCSDDFLYAGIVRRIIDKSFSVQWPPFHNRFGLIFPVAFCVRWLGMNPWSYVLWPMLCSCITVLLVFCWTTCRYGRTAAIFAGILMATSASQIHWAMHVMPDVVLGTMLFCAVLCVESSRTSTNPGSRWGWAAAFGVAMFCAICTKLPAMWIAPFLAISLVIDLATKRAWKPWLAIVISGAISAVAYMVMYWALTGDALYRIHAIENVFAANSPEVVEYSRAAYIQRLIYEPSRLIMGDRHFRTLCFFTLCVLAGLRPRKPQAQSGVVRLALYALTFCLVFWFGSISISRYWPIDPLGRYLVPMIPPMAVCGGVMLATIVASPETSPSILNRFRKLPHIRSIGLVLATLFFLAQMLYISVAIHRGLTGETKSAALNRRFVADRLGQHSDPVVVYTDSRSAETFSFYLDMLEQHTVLTKRFAEYNPEDTTNAVRYLYINRNVLSTLRNLYEISYDENIAQLLEAGSWESLTITPDVEIYKSKD